ncbi:MAG TPA: NTP pyrophosphohydrolase [Kribbellaceae bacterium]|nr:NTP pyrophosphohydrolase [Kribbellaceae bacterium]
MALAPLVVVDAANVVGSRPDGWWRDRPAAVRRLLDTITAGLDRRADVVLVVEGAARAGVEPGVHDGVRVVHAPGSGDDEIVRIVATEADAAHRPVTVVTADRPLRERVTALGAAVLGPRQYLAGAAGSITRRPRGRPAGPARGADPPARPGAPPASG